VGLIRVHPVVLSDASDEILASADRFGDLLDRVDQGVRELASTWSGSASDGFQSKVAQWSAASLDLHASLEQLKVLLTTANANYAAVEEANLATWQTP
jgi:6 kDa early secretory antigenic target